MQQEPVKWLPPILFTQARAIEQLLCTQPMSQSAIDQLSQTASKAWEQWSESIKPKKGITELLNKSRDTQAKIFELEKVIQEKEKKLDDFAIEYQKVTLELNAVRTKNTFLEQKTKFRPDSRDFSTQTDFAEPPFKEAKSAKKTRNSMSLDPKEKEQKGKMLYLSSHIDELTEDIEQLQNSLLASHDQPAEYMDEIKEEVDDLSPIAGKHAVSAWSVNGSHVFMDHSAVSNKENKISKDQSVEQAAKLEKLQEEYGKIKAKMTEYQQNNAVYLNEIKALKEQLSCSNAELATVKASKSKVREMEKEKELHSAISLKEITEHKHRITELERALENAKEQVIKLENKCLKLKLEKEQLGIKLERKLPLIDYLKTGLPSIIEKMVLLITAIESEARNLMKTIKKYKEKRKRPSIYGSSSEEESDEEEYSKRSSIGRKKVSTSLEKIGCLEKEIKQICSRISTLNHCLNDEDDADYFEL